MGHLTSFYGTDVIPAIYQLENSYNADGLIGGSVPASEHSVMCMGTKDGEIDTVERLLSIYKKEILSLVMDTWDITKVSKPSEDGTLFKLKEKIINRNGKLVIRPDSSPNGRNPADILCGHNLELNDREKEAYYPEFYNKGLIECLWDIFGGTINEQGYKVLDAHIGAIYGDSITLQIAEEICKRLKEKGFATTNVVLGIGSMTYQGGETNTNNQYWITRDLFGFAVKATYGELLSKDGVIERREIFKDPITDDGTKKSKKGLLSVVKQNEKLLCLDCCTYIQEDDGELKTVFENGELIFETTLEEIRNKLMTY